MFLTKTITKNMPSDILGAEIRNQENEVQEFEITN